MINSILHFTDLSLKSVDVYSYQSDMRHTVASIELSDIQKHLVNTSNIFLMLPSQLFGFLSYQNDQHYKGEVLQANVFAQIEDQLISDVSSLQFFYSAEWKLASWIDSEIYHSVISFFDDVDAEITILPEHFLLQSNGTSIFIQDNYFIAAFRDHSGFGGSLATLTNYIDTLDPGALHSADLTLLGEHPIDGDLPFDVTQMQSRSLHDLHVQLIERENLASLNMFRRRLSINYLKLKLKLTTLESRIIGAALMITFLAPLVINSLLSSFLSSYQDSTIEVFRQLNPTFTRLVNPKAQIDDLTRDIPLQITASSQDLNALIYIESLADESIRKIQVDLKNNTVRAAVENLAPYKLGLIQAAINQSNSTMDAQSLVEGADGLYGLITIQYNAE
tara:strand:- start:641 stop:1813 length:1173 start_codon:yes stop_codon:yes gene_type:complete